MNLISPFLWIGTIMDSFHSCVNSSLFQMSTMSLCISSYNLPPPAWINSDWIWWTPVAVCLFNFSIASYISLRLDSRISGSAVYTSITKVLWKLIVTNRKNSSWNFMQPTHEWNFQYFSVATGKLYVTTRLVGINRFNGVQLGSINMKLHQQSLKRFTAKLQQ